MKTPGLRVISGAAAVAASPLDADAFQAACVEGLVASWAARGFSPVTIENATGVLDRFLELLGIPAWAPTTSTGSWVSWSLGGWRRRVAVGMCRRSRTSTAS